MKVPKKKLPAIVIYGPRQHRILDGDAATKPITAARIVKTPMIQSNITIADSNGGNIIKHATTTNAIPVNNCKTQKYCKGSVRNFNRLSLFLGFSFHDGSVSPTSEETSR